MKYIFLMLASILMHFSTQAQDHKDFFVINDDTIHCEITRVGDEYLFYRIGEMRSRIELNDVDHYSIMEEQISEEKNLVTTNDNETNRLLIDEYISKDFRKKVRFSLNIGVGYRIGRAEESIPKDYLKQLRIGSNVDIKLQGFERNVGLSLEYNRFLSYAEGDFPGLGYVTDDISISYLGLGYIKRTREGNKNIGFAGFSFGALAYKNNATIDREELAISGVAFGFRAHYDFDIPINKFISLGLNADLILGVLKEVEINGNTYTAQGTEDGENISRVNLGAGIRFGL